MKNKKKREEAQAYLESLGAFDIDYLPQSIRYIKPDKDYVYDRNGIFNRLGCACVRTITFLFGASVSRLVFGTRVKGKKNIKGIKGAISITNHVHILDTLFVKQAIGHYRSYHTAAPHNNRRGFGGAFLRGAGLIPLTDGLAASRKLYAYADKLLKKGGIINFYPEQTLWVRYRRPRPFKSGAFKYAVNFNVPIIPIFVTFEEGRRGKTHAVVNVEKPVYPDLSLPPKQRAEKLSDDCRTVWQDVYRRAYEKCDGK